MKTDLVYDNLIENYTVLKDGMEFKSYRDLCNILQQPILTGNSKNSQLKLFERFFTYHKEGYKIIIDSVYSEPLEEESKGMFSPLIQKLVLDFLFRTQLSTGDYEIFTTKKELDEQLGLTKKEYGDYINNQQELSTLLNIDIGIVSEFYNRTNGKLSDYYDTAFNALVKRSIISMDKTFIIKPKYEKLRLPTTDERRLILEADYSARLELTPTNYKTKETKTGLKDMYDIQDIVLFGLWKKYEKLMNTYVNDNGGSHIQYFYKGYHIILTKNVKTAKDSVDDYILKNKNEIKDVLTTLFLNSHKESYHRLHEKAEKELQSRECVSTLNKALTVALRAQDHYIQSGERLIDATLNPNEKFESFVIPQLIYTEEIGIPF